MVETRATARLPGLDIEIAHRVEEDAERLVIALRATPSFDAALPLLQMALFPALWWLQATSLATQSFPFLPSREK
jgi:hypothetical protein